MSLYALKTTLLAPRTAYRRRREAGLDPVTRSILERHYYSQPMYDFMATMGANPDMLVEADLDRRSIVMDVGAYTGEWSEQISRRYGARIHAFEPNPDAFRTLTERLLGHPNVTALCYGLGGADERAFLSLVGPGSSLFTRPPGFGTAEVQVRDVVAVMDELGIDHVDLCKVNIEGGEFDLLERLIAVDRLRRIRLVSVQFHEWHPGAYRRRRAIRRALARMHDEVWNYPWVWELWRRRS
jgi:FkbM family methyltransferase